MSVKTPPIKDLLEVTEDQENGLTFMKNVSIPLKDSPLPIRANVYLPLTSDKAARYPVLVTYGPYGKDIPYAKFYPKSFSEVAPDQRSKYSAWETPDPVFWTSQGYAIVRADERGLGQSPGLLDTMSRGTSECFFDVVEWAADQPWSNGKVGLLGISYYAGSQWRVAARRPKGLAAIIPWEGMSDYYRDRCRHGGIHSNKFIGFWWNRQVLVNQYGRKDRSKLDFPPDGPGARGQEDTIEGDLPEDVLVANRQDQTKDNEANRFRDDDYYASKEYKLEDIEVPVLSVANWGGILLHLRGNVQGYLGAGSQLKYLRFITGRHDLPFYYPEEVELQKSFLDAFLKGEDRVGWSTPGKVPPVTLTLRKGNVGFNDAEKEKAYPKREEAAWPIPRTDYTNFYLTPDLGLTTNGSGQDSKTVSYKALGSLENPQVVSFTSAPFEQETEITGHVTAHLNVSVTPDNSENETDIDLFVTLRHIDPSGQEVFYTGTAGDPVPLVKGWLRVSNRKVHHESPKHKSWLPHREYLSTDVLPVKAGEVYGVDIEVWPTNVVVDKGGKIVFEVSSGDTQGSGIFQHCSEVDRCACAEFASWFGLRVPDPSLLRTFGGPELKSGAGGGGGERVRRASKPTLNALAAVEKTELGILRKNIQQTLSDESTLSEHGVPIAEVQLHLPIKVDGFTDFSCSKEHLLNASEAVVGKASMPPAAPYLPIGYSGRPSSIVLSGTNITRPYGQYRDGNSIGFGPSRALDYELEVACIIGKPTQLGDRVAVTDADEHIFGLVLLNDWSARDIQGFEMSPLGPMNGKSFGTSISPWVITLEALEPFATQPPPKDIPSQPYLLDNKEKSSYNIALKAEVVTGNGATTVCKAQLSWMYWTFRDLVAQQTINGCNLNTGDILATGTVSGAGDDEHGCLLEMTKGGKVGWKTSTGQDRMYLQDGDGVRISGQAGDGVGFGDCVGFIGAARPFGTAQVHL
ncbi:X-Pro dipeptidyl-peptidase C-terminal non-catalytic domain-containing protein [Colletotrichum costaricense]|uniref:X-Pro dipeptidyl-peptidase C-terminal non-catalytic domain-containing protein n=1 Tax=Colletotrichum costaricense TaxID=1209916 RepID=A0AAI9ZAM9_9PEZI|nr:X-Pro dipeptidyl-peptidase C-terminal non-catalytic domain-containing protein [Colletotrichum costaricense]KAK1539847.1 X-Pro dipeptidyl-peptidase C-terminal non-catalytic domain-containing protein [Colletotrichum costaricense]